MKISKCCKAKTRLNTELTGKGNTMFNICSSCSQACSVIDEPNRTDWQDSEATVMAEYPNIQVIVDKHYEEALYEIFKVYDIELHELSIRIETVDGLVVEKSYRNNQEILEAQNE